MEEKDFKLLKKYRLINNLITVKNMKPEREAFWGMVKRMKNNVYL